MSTVTRQLQVLDEQDQPLLKVAFASASRSKVDQHFGSAKAFAIYGVGPERAQLLSVAEFSEEAAQDGNEDKLVARFELLEGCAAVYCRACGASAVRQLLAAGIQPVKVADGAEIEDLLRALQKELQEGPSAWLAKAIRRGQGGDNQRFDAMAAEGWDE